MKPYVVLILLALSIGVATAVHYTKLKQPGDIDRFSKTLLQLQPYISLNTPIGFKGEPSKGELLTWTRYVLAPAYIDPEPADTTLVIQYRNNSDTSMLHFMTGRQVLHQVADSQFVYSITINY